MSMFSLCDDEDDNSQIFSIPSSNVEGSGDSLDFNIEEINTENHSDDSKSNCINAQFEDSKEIDDQVPIDDDFGTFQDCSRK